MMMTFSGFESSAGGSSFAGMADGMAAGFVSNSPDKKSRAVLSSMVFYRETTLWSPSIFPLSMYAYKCIWIHIYANIHTVCTYM